MRMSKSIRLTLIAIYDIPPVDIAASYVGVLGGAGPGERYSFSKVDNKQDELKPRPVGGRLPTSHYQVLSPTTYCHQILVRDEAWT